MKHVPAIRYLKLVTMLGISGALLYSTAAQALRITRQPSAIPVSPSEEIVSWETDASTDVDIVSHGPEFPRWIPAGDSIAGVVRDIDLMSPQRGWLVSWDGTNGHLYILSSLGTVWFEVAGFNFLPSSVAGQDDGTAWVAGSAERFVYRYRSGTFTPVIDSGMTGVWDIDVAGGMVWVAGTSNKIVSYNIATGVKTEYTTGAFGVYLNITAFDATHVWAATNSVYHLLSTTTNGGATWSNFDQGGFAINDIKAVAQDEAYAAASSGRVFHYKAGSWTNQTVPITSANGIVFNPDYLSIGAPHLTTIWLFGCCVEWKDYAVMSEDSGATWKQVGSVPGTTAGIFLPSYTGTSSSSFAPGNAGWLGGSLGNRLFGYDIPYGGLTNATSGVVHTASLTGLQQSVNYHANAVSSAGNDTAESGDFSFKTQGLEILFPGVSVTPAATTADISWNTPGTVPADSRVYASPGVGWRSSTNFPATTFKGIDATGDTAFAVGAVENIVMKTGDLGRTWSTVTTPPNFAEAISMRGSHGWMVGNNFVARTTDGAIWIYQSVPTNYYFGVYAHDDLHAWVVGRNLATSTGVIIRTSDGGNKWETVLEPKKGLRDVQALDASNTVIATGDSGTIYRSTDAGTTWMNVPSGTSASLNRLSMVNDLIGWTVGDSGVVLRTEDGGKTWGIAPGLAGCTSNPLLDVSAVSSTDVWVVGATGTVKHWTQAGGCQTELIPGVTATTELKSVDTDGVNVWIAGVDTITGKGFVARKGLDTTNPQFQERKDAAFVSSHTPPATRLTNLTSNTTYNYFVQSNDAKGFSVASPLSTFTTLSEPTLAVSPTSLTFTAQEGGPNPTPQKFTVRDKVNANADIGPWTATKTAGGAWLNFAPSNGGATPQDVTVSPDITGLTAGTYTGTIRVDATAPGVLETPKNVDITLTITQAPRLQLTPGPSPALRFTAQEGGPNPSAQAVDITNAGGGIMSYTATNVGGATWLSFAPNSGSLATGGTDRFVITVNVISPVRLTPGTYTEKIRVAGAAGTKDSPQDITVNLTVTAAPRLELTPGPNPTLTFNAVEQGANPPKQTVSIRNAGGGNMTWTASSSAAWLTFSPAGGGNGPTVMDVTPQTGALAAGRYTGTITVNAGAITDSPQAITVIFDIAAAPKLEVNPLTITFTTPQGTNPPDQSFTVTSCSGSGWSATAVSGGNWLQLPGANSGPSCPSGNVLVHAEVVAAGLGIGTYNGTITVTSTGALPSSVTINVILNVTEPPRLAVNPRSLTFSATEGAANPGPQQFQIANIGAGVLNWSINQPADAWAYITTGLCAGKPGPLSGTAPSSINVCVDITGLAAGPRRTTSVLVESPGSLDAPQDVTINLDVAPDSSPPVPDPASIQITTGFDCAANDVFAHVKWTTNEYGDSQVYYGETVDGGGVPLYELPAIQTDLVDIVAHTGGVIDHDVLLDGLNGGRRYYVKFRSTDRYGNTSAFVDRDPKDPALYLGFIAPANCDKNPPTNVVLTVPPNPLAGTVTVRVDAQDESGVDYVELWGDWDPANPFATLQPVSCVPAGPVFNCTVSYNWDTRLLPDGIYTIFARAYDVVLNSADSAPVQVEISNTAPTVTNVKASPYFNELAGSWEATITWDTDKPSGSRVDYGPEDPVSGAFSYNLSVSADDSGRNDLTSGPNEHTVTLKSLLGGRLYHFQVTSCLPANPLLCGH